MPILYNEPEVLQVVDELNRAMKQHGPMRSPHEGWAVLYEEVDELWDEVRAKEHDLEKMKKEARQAAAMALRFMIEVCRR